nr:MAG TPA: hypothetical protein [Caudoviricetes sp.]
MVTRSTVRVVVQPVSILSTTAKHSAPTATRTYSAQGSGGGFRWLYFIEKVEFEEVNIERPAGNSFQNGNSWKALERFRRDLGRISPFWRPILSNFPIFGKNRDSHFEDFLGKVGGLIPLSEKNRRAGANYRGMLVSWSRNV